MEQNILEILIFLEIGNQPSEEEQGRLPRTHIECDR